MVLDILVFCLLGFQVLIFSLLHLGFLKNISLEFMILIFYFIEVESFI